MLSQDHPFFHTIVRLRYAMAAEQHTETSEPLSGPQLQEMKDLLVRLENGLFERLPQYVIDAVFLHRERLTQSLDPIIVEIARHVASGRSVPTVLHTSFKHRMRTHHTAVQVTFGVNAFPHLPPR